MLATITPHWSEYIWLEVLKKPSTITFEKFPTFPAADLALTAAMNYARQIQSNIGSTEGNMLKRLGKGKGVTYDPKVDKKLTIYIADSFPKWQDDLIELVREHLADFDLKKIMPKVDKKNKKAMPFLAGLKKSLDSGDQTVLERKLAFDEEAVLKEMVPSFKATVYKCQEVEIVKVDFVVVVAAKIAVAVSCLLEVQ